MTDQTSTPSKRSKNSTIALLGVALYTGPIWGLFGTVFAMIKAFQTLSENSESSSDALSQNISLALTTTSIGIALALVGTALILFAFHVSKTRKQWFYQWVTFLSYFYCVVLFPYSLAFNLPLALFFNKHRASFSSQK